jgi:hypothetical protein
VSTLIAEKPAYLLDHDWELDARWEQLSIQALSEEVLGAGTATPEQIDEQLAKLEDPDYRGYGFTWIAARGRRPNAG